MKKISMFKHYTMGGQTSFHNVRMWDQITLTLVLICLYTWVLLTGLICYWVVSWEHLRQAVAYYYALFFKIVHYPHIFTLVFHGKTYKQTVEMILYYPYYKDNAQQVVNSIGRSALLAFAISCCIGAAMVFYFIKKGKSKTERELVRGANIVSVTELREQIIAKKLASDLTIDDLPLIKDTEVEHMLVHGTVGKGKSQLIMKLLDQLRARGDRVIIYDKGGSFTSAFFDETKDVLLNPFDARCANWNLWLEARNDADMENMAESAIPVEGESQPFFVHAARAVFSATGSRMRSDSDCSLKKLLQFLLTGEFEQMEPYLAGTPAATLLSGKVEKMAISVRAMITTYVRSLQSLIGLEESGKKPFCIRDYILDEKTNGWLFISSNGEKHNSLKPLMSMWLSTASLALLSLPENLNRRIWFICDELPSLQKLPFLGSTIAEVRKFGGCFVLGMQNFYQLAQVYGTKGAGAIFDLLNTRFYFRNPSYEMAKLVSAELCNEDVNEVKESTSYGANSIRDGVSLSTQRTTRPIVDYSEIIKLNTMACFARLPGDFPITKIEMKLKKRPEKCPGFIPREMPLEKKNNSFWDFRGANPVLATNEVHQSKVRQALNFDVEFDV